MPEPNDWPVYDGVTTCLVQVGILRNYFGGRRPVALLTTTSGRRQLALEKNAHQGHYGEAFVRALAGAAGLQPMKKEPDVDGIDFVIGYPGPLGRARSPSIEVQVKSWSRPTESRTDWRFRELTERQFNNLAGNFALPRFLFLVIVPNDASKYTDARPDALRLNHAAYWASLRCLTPIANASKKKRKLVEVPKTNLLTVTSLLELLASAWAEE